MTKLRKYMMSLCLLFKKKLLISNEPNRKGHVFIINNINVPSFDHIFLQKATPFFGENKHFILFFERERENNDINNFSFSEK